MPDHAWLYRQPGGKYAMTNYATWRLAYWQVRSGGRRINMQKGVLTSADVLKRVHCSVTQRFSHVAIKQ